ncbi:MAG: hypothetical protein ACTS5A_04085 [Candidatus Hodgkinia cicadicola]
MLNEGRIPNKIINECGRGKDASAERKLRLINRRTLKESNIVMSAEAED